MNRVHLKQGVLLFGCLVLLGVGACPKDCPVSGGFAATDFEPISANGFDLADNLLDKNDYAWGMTYFQPDCKAEGHVYIATGNNMLGLMIGGMMAILGEGTLDNIEVCPPEIRRYRPDLGPMAWERVFDYRDVETGPDFRTIGFRIMTTYRAQSDGINYIYAATFGQDATVWRSSTGERGSWEIAWQSGALGSVRFMAEHDGLLYLSLANDTAQGEQRPEIWATDGDTFWAVVDDGFGNPANTGIMSLISYNGWLYAGTQNQGEGFEIWKLEGPEKNGVPIQVVAAGGNDSRNESAITPCVFQGKLYWGTMIYHMTSIMGGFKGAEIIRISEDDTWDTVMGPDSISGYDSGFDHWPNTYVWWMTEHDGWLYASTYDQLSSLTGLPAQIPDILATLIGALKRSPGFIDVVGRSGGDLYKSPDGETWCPVTLDGLGDVGNYGFRTMCSVEDTLYVGTANPFDGLEVWKATTEVE